MSIPQTSAMPTLMLSLRTQQPGASTLLNVSSKCTSVDMSVENFVYSMVMSFIMFFSVSGNLIVILIVCMSNLLRKSRTYYFIVSLACADILSAACTVPFKISVKIHGSNFCHGISACYLLMLTDVLTNVACILNLLLISIERFVAIQIPYQYFRLLSSRISKCLIGGVWCFSCAWSIAGLYNWNVSDEENYHAASNQRLRFNNTDQSIYSIEVRRMCRNKNTCYFVVSFYVIYIPTLIVMTGIYLTILRTTFTHIKHIKHHSCVQGAIESVIDESSTSKSLSHKTLAKKKSCGTFFHQELQATKSVAIVYVAFCVCWLPSCVITTIIHADKDYFVRLHQKNKSLFLTVYYLFIEVLPLLNTMVNPIIYSFSNKQFRAVAVSLWRKVPGHTSKQSTEFALITFDRKVTYNK